MIQKLLELQSALLQVITALEISDLATPDQINQLKDCERVVQVLIDLEMPSIGLTD
jgi:hypothetical protein